jgi:hypothetical protein
VSACRSITHTAQTVSIIALLKLHWPRSVETTTSFLTVDFLEWSSTRPECLAQNFDEKLADHGGVAVIYTTVRVALLLVLLQSISLLQLLTKARAKWCNADLDAIEKRVDRLEMFETVLFSVQLTAALRLCTQVGSCSQDATAHPPHCPSTLLPIHAAIPSPHRARPPRPSTLTTARPSPSPPLAPPPPPSPPPSLALHPHRLPLLRRAQLIDAMFTGSQFAIIAGFVGWLLLATQVT